MTIDIDRIRRMAAAGLTTRETAELLSCSHTRVAQILAQHGPAHVSPVSISAISDGVVITTQEPQIVSVAITRALRRAGIEVHALAHPDSVMRPADWKAVQRTVQSLWEKARS